MELVPGLAVARQLRLSRARVRHHEHDAEFRRDALEALRQPLEDGALIACMLLHPATVFFFLYYCGVLGFIEWYFYRRIAKLSDQINASMENASGSFVESAANILSVKAMNAGADMTARVAAREQAARDQAARDQAAREQERASLPANSPRRAELDKELKGLNLVLEKNMAVSSGP